MLRDLVDVFAVLGRFLGRSLLKKQMDLDKVETAWIKAFRVCIRVFSYGMP